MGGVLLALPVLWLVASIVLFAVAPKPSFAAIMIFAATAVVGIGLLYVSAMVLTWRRGRFRRSPMPLWSRWYGLVAVAAIGIIASQLLVPIAHRYYKPFYIPSENMAPTLAKLDKIVADMRGGRNPSVGDIVLIQTAHGAYIKRVVALPGDRIAIRADIPIVNGLRAQVRQAGTAYFPGTNGLEQATLFSETLPGENGSHDIAIIEPGEYADMAERTVPAGHIFVLGDNRDRSADSRVPPEEFGLGMVPMAHLIGRPLYITWSRERGSSAGRGLGSRPNIRFRIGTLNQSHRGDVETEAC